jgi:uncharacterized protein YcbK (DUF882 family)
MGIGDKRCFGQQGSVLVSMVLVVFASVVAMAFVANTAVAAINSARAQAVADAAALGAARDGLGSARELVNANGASVVTAEIDGFEAQIMVEVAGQRAVARAVARVGHEQHRAGLAPAMVAVLARAEQLLGQQVVVVSGFRSREHQERLWEHRHENPYPVAPPGSSAHELGLAIDVVLWQVPLLVAIAGDAGLCHPLPTIDPVHFVTCPIPA